MYKINQRSTGVQGYVWNRKEEKKEKEKKNFNWENSFPKAIPIT